MGKMTPTSMEYYGIEEHEHDMANIVGHPGYKIIAKFNGDWLNDLDTAIGLADKMQYQDLGEQSCYLYDAQMSDKMPTLNKMASLLGFETCSSNQVQMQRPGCVFARHQDPYKDPEIRVLITLAHWEWGQFIFINDSIVRYWKPGEVIYAEFNNMIHCTCNCSYHTRPILQITGKPTQELKNLIASDQIINIDI